MKVFCSLCCVLYFGIVDIYLVFHFKAYTKKRALNNVRLCTGILLFWRSAGCFWEFLFRGVFHIFVMEAGLLGGQKVLH